MITMTTNLTIHRLLDEAFAGLEPTPAALDFKEELRANLVARVEELEASGVAPDEAAHRAIDEVGDIRALLDDAAEERGGRPHSIGEAWLQHRVRYSGGFVVRVTVASILGAAALVFAFVVGAGLLPGGAIVAAALIIVFAALLGLVCGDSLGQETTRNYPTPRGRAAGYGIGLALLLAGVGGIALCWVGPWPLWAWCAAGGVLALAGIGTLSWLGATQTNRQKPWMRVHGAEWGERFAREHEAAWSVPSGDRFSRDPNAAARFGIYTMVIWVAATAVALVLGFTVGWWWSALPWVAAFIAMMLLLTRMLFAPEKEDRR